MVRRPVYIERPQAPIDGTQSTAYPSAEGYSYQDRIANGVPGFKTSATFLTSLSANLLLPDAYDPNAPSPLSTPPSMRASTELSSSAHLAPPSPLAFAFAASSTDPPSDALGTSLAGLYEGVLDTVYTPAITDAEKAAALQLVADSVAAQRRAAMLAVLLHPSVLGVYAALLALVARALYRNPCSSTALVTVFTSLTIAALVGVRWLTAGYTVLAAEIDWAWLAGDTVIIAKVARSGEVIGAVVLGWVCEGRGSGRRRNKGRGAVRAWTVAAGYRGNGVGAGLLEEAVRVVGERGREGVGFAEEHAHWERVLKSWFNGVFERRDRRARKKLQDIVDSRADFGRRR
ncbi:hypothetical protein H2199_003630 [Coniosporium tulheliwenetii]|uniref:Uncharacterized protein n=1 Tax=Coniosporium tulheliwenetii TaxID=3383036 RepID=A0ACC2ZA90_9PEZI|nr:hypothetical protein H2199_003630 [Cladosporium sp. JES 115]